MNTPPRYFIFDLDGTLAISEHLHLEAWQTACREAGLPRMTRAQYYKLNGKPTAEVVSTHLCHHGIEPDAGLLQQLIAAKRAIFRQSLHRIERNEAIAGLLAALSPHYKTALATTSIKEHALIILDQLGLGDMFDVMVFGDDVEHNKPHPECYILAAQRLGAQPDQCIVFEDSESGVMAAKVFGAHVVRVVR